MLQILKTNQFEKEHSKVHHLLIGQSNLKMGNLHGITFGVQKICTTTEVKLKKGIGDTRQPWGDRNIK